jgi:nuclear pore complex protein Nup93
MKRHFDNPNGGRRQDAVARKDVVPRGRTMTERFAALREKSSNLVRGIAGGRDSRVLRKTLPQLNEANRKLVRQPVGPESKQQAALLLAPVLDIGAHDQALQRIDLTKQYDPRVPLGDVDVGLHVQHQHHMMVTNAIEESANLSSSHFRSHYVARIEEDWEQAKREILEHLGQRLDQRQGPDQGGGARDQGALVLHGDASYDSRGQMDAGMGQYGRGPQSSTAVTLRSAPDSPYYHVIEAFNTDRVSNREFDLLGAFIRAEQDIDQDYGIIDQWELLRSISSNFDAKHPGTERGLLDGAIRFSESEYYGHVCDTCRSKPHVARVGGNPTPLNHIKGYINVMFKNDKDQWICSAEVAKDMVDGFPLWLLLYYSYRCGQFEEVQAICLRAIKQGKSNVETFRAAFLSRLEHKQDGRPGLDVNVWNALYKEYDSVETARNPFKVALLHLLGKFPVQDHVAAELYKTVFTKTEDYIWQKLNLVWDSESNRAAGPTWLPRETRLTLAEFQATVVEHGPSYFNPTGQNPLWYFKILLMSLQFARAVHYLTATDRPRLFAFGVHFAATLRYLGLLEKSAMSVQEVDYEWLIRLVWKYIAPFVKLAPDRAFQYLLLLYSRESYEHGGGNEPRARKEIFLFEEQIIRLLWETKEYHRLIGTTGSHDRINPGLIYEYIPELADRIIHATGEKAEELGAFEDAMAIFTLARCEEEVGEIIIEQLSALVHMHQSHPERAFLLEKTRSLLQVYHQSGGDAGAHPASPDFSSSSNFTGREGHQKAAMVNRSLECLHRLANFFDLYHLQRLDDAEREVMGMGVIEFNPQDLHSRNDGKFQSLDERIKPVFRYVVKALMQIYSTKHKYIASTWADATSVHTQRRTLAPDVPLSHKIMVELRERVDALINFVCRQKRYLDADDVIKQVLELKRSF